MKNNIFNSFIKSFVIFSLFFTLSCNKNQSTIDSQTQETASKVLENQLKKYDAKSGYVIVMEVAKGKVKALVNIAKDEKGNYQNSENIALNDYSEPGNLFAPISLLMALNDGFVDEKTIINTDDGQWNYEGTRISDSHGGNYTLGEMLAKSSNIAIAKIITQNYDKTPQNFYKYLKEWKFLEKIDDGKTSSKSVPEIILPENKMWNNTLLASASYGYSIKVSPLQITNFYNAIANNGTMLKPLFNENNSEQKTKILVQKIASENALTTLKNALIESVENGTPKSEFTPNLKIAGKSATTRLEYWKEGPAKYRSSFVGFFPADKPKYTCLVMINEPNSQKGFYGAMVASPVFKEIAGFINKN